MEEGKLLLWMFHVDGKVEVFIKILMNRIFMIML